MTKLLYLLLFFFFAASTIQAQKDALTPKVINIKNNSALLETLSTEFKSSLFSASDTNVVKTMQNWKQLLTAMEAYSEEIKFDLKGVKIWLKVFWAKDGNIEHMAYYLADNSKNIDLIDLEAFLRSFMRNYKLPISYKQRFSYDARIQFPLYLMR